MYKKYLLGIRKFWKTSNLSSDETCLGKLNILFYVHKNFSTWPNGQVFLCLFGHTNMFMQITNPDGGIVGANRQVFTPLHSNVSNWVSMCIKYCVQESLTWIFGLNRSNTTRTQFETQMFTISAWNI